MATFAAYAAITANPMPIQLLLSLSALSLLVVGAAYGGNRPSLLFKRSEGTRAWWAWGIMWPYYGMVWTSFWVYRVTNRQAASTEISKGIWLSRRLLYKESRRVAVKWAAVVDLAAEFGRTPLPETAYLSLPVLDGIPPSIEQLRLGIDWINQHQTVAIAHHAQCRQFEHFG